MRSGRRTALLTAFCAGAVVCAATTAGAAPGPPTDVRPTADFVRRAPCASFRLILCTADPPLALGWGAAGFTSGSTARRYLVDPIVDIDGADPQAVIVTDAAATGTSLNVINGHLYHLRILASESLDGATTVNSPVVERAFRVDATPPTAAVTVAGGATFTRSREVTVEVSASDPPTAGAFAASGLGGVAAWSGPPPGLDGIAVPFRPSLTVTLAPGPDGPRTVTTIVFDRARHPLSVPPAPFRLPIELFPATRIERLPVQLPDAYVIPPRPFVPRFPIGGIGGIGDGIIRTFAGAPAPAPPPEIALVRPRVIDISEVRPFAEAPPPPVNAVTNGNASAAATGQIVLDTTAPVGAPAITPASSPAGVPIAFDATRSQDATSGVDAARTSWDFGDGSPAATGTTVAHTYAAAGTYTGALTLTDLAGNVSATPFSVRVSARIATDGGGATTSGGARRTGVRSTSAVRSSIGAGLDGARARLVASWRQSVLSGRILLRGRSLRDLRLTVELRPRARGLGPARRVAGTLGVRRGVLERTLRLPPGLLPGAYDLQIESTGGPVLRRVLTLRIPAPREGVAASAAIALTPSGAPLRIAPRGVRRLNARFTLASLPAVGQALTVTWIHPDGRPVGTARKARARRVVSFVRSAEALPSGRWRAVLQAGAVRVAEAVVRIP